MPESTPAERVWAQCEISKRQVGPDWSTRDVIIHAIGSFAEYWDPEFGFRLYDDDDAKELARWIGQHLDAAGKLTEWRRSRGADLDLRDLTS